MPLFLLLILAAASGLGAAALCRTLLDGGRRLTPFNLAWAVLIAAAAVLAIVTALVAGTDLLGGLDREVAQWAYDHATAFSHRGLRLVTDLGETWTVIVVAVVVAVVDIRRRHNLWALPFLLVVILGDKLLTQLLKHLVDRARPTLEPVAATLGPSFPSGHSSTAAASWAAFALVAGLWWGRRSWPPLSGVAVGIAVAVALSRVFLDVHWTTDVIGGLALGWAWFALCAIAFDRWLRVEVRQPRRDGGRSPRSG